jgi:hypothetical protein
MSDDFISISNADLHGITGGKGTPTPTPTPTTPTTPPTPPTAPPDDTGQYCKEGMQRHVGIGGDAGIETPLGFKVQGGFRYDETVCK